MEVFTPQEKRVDSVKELEAFSFRMGGGGGGGGERFSHCRCEGGRGNFATVSRVFMFYCWGGGGVRAWGGGSNSRW